MTHQTQTYSLQIESDEDGVTSPGDLKRSLLKKIIRDAGLTEDEFRKLL